MSNQPIERLGSLESSLFANFNTNTDPSQNSAAIADLEKELASSLQPKPNTAPPKLQQLPTFLAYLTQVARTLTPDKAKVLSEFIISFSKQKKDAQETVRFLTNLIGKSLTEAAINCGLKEGIFKLPPQAEMKKVQATTATTAPTVVPPTVTTTATQPPQSMGPTVFTGNLATLRNNPQLQQQVLSKLPPNLTPEQRANVLQQLASGNRLIPIIGTSQPPTKQVAPPPAPNTLPANKKPKIEGGPTVITTVANTGVPTKPVVATTQPTQPGAPQPSPFANLKTGVNIVGMAKQDPVDTVKELSDLSRMVGLELPKGEPPKLGDVAKPELKPTDEASFVNAAVLKRKVMESVAKAKGKNLTVSEEVYKYLSLGIQEHVKVLILGLCRECAHKSVNPESNLSTFTITSDVKKQLAVIEQKEKEEELRRKKLKEEELLKQQQEREKKEAEAATSKEGATISTTNSAALQAIGDVKVKTKPETAPVLSTNLGAARPNVSAPTQQMQPLYANMTIQQQINTLKLQLQTNQPLTLTNWHFASIKALNDKSVNKTITSEENDLFTILKAWLAKMNQQKNRPRTINAKDLMYNPHITRLTFTKHEIAKKRRERAQSQRSRMIQGVKAPMMTNLSSGVVRPM